MGPETSRRLVLYCRLPGLLALAAKEQRQDAAASPLVVAEAAHVRDACPLAFSRGITRGLRVLQARRLCPVLLVVPLSIVDCRLHTRLFLDHMADLSPVVEPEGPDAAYADLTGIAAERAGSSLTERTEAALGLVPRIGWGSCRITARAVAECGLPADRWAEADAHWLWPEEAEVVSRLMRLGLSTFGQVAALSESALVYQFGRRGRLLYRRACGRDFMPVRARYPLPRAEARRDFSPHAISDWQQLQRVLVRMSRGAARQLRHLGCFGRRLVLQVANEGGELRNETVLSTPVQEEAALMRAAHRLLVALVISTPVTAMRLRVDELEEPSPQTLDLFTGRQQRSRAVLKAVEQALAARYGPRVLTRLGEWPVPPREKRRELLSDRWEGEG